MFVHLRESFCVLGIPTQSTTESSVSPYLHSRPHLIPILVLTIFISIPTLVPVAVMFLVPLRRYDPSGNLIPFTVLCISPRSHKATNITYRPR
jgi:hypothetical protein